MRRIALVLVVYAAIAYLLAPARGPATHALAVLPSPRPIVLKNQFWSWLRPALAKASAK